MAERSRDVPEGAYACLEVSDTGSGMDEETKANAFDPFFTSKFTGRGRGRAAVLCIVRGHGGAIMVEGNPGRGSTFKVLLPRCGGPAVGSGAQEAPPQQNGTEARRSIRGHPGPCYAALIGYSPNSSRASTMARRFSGLTPT